MHELPGSVNMLLHMRCEVPAAYGYMDINDQTVIQHVQDTSISAFDQHACI